MSLAFVFFFLRFIYLFIFREGGREGEREGEKLHVWLPLAHTLLGTCMATNPGTCPDWESNHQPFGSQARAQSTELYQPGPMSLFMEWNKTAPGYMVLRLIFLREGALIS